jgi:ADP-ribose pyrophosphatase
MSLHVVYRGRKIQVAVDSTPLDNGVVVQRDVVIHPGAVAILPLLDADRICLVRNQRPVVGETLLEIPAGTLEPPEPPDTAARRELAEETGYRAGKWTKLTEFYPSPGVLSERTHLYLAEELTPGDMHTEQDEHIIPEIMGWREALVLALDGRIRDAKTLIALLWYARARGNERE